MAAASLSLLAFPVAGCAASQPATRSVAGARATLIKYADALLTGNGGVGCSLLTPAAREQLVTRIAAVYSTHSCQQVFALAAYFMKSRPGGGAQLRSDASTVKITVVGNTATVSDLTEHGNGTMTYRDGRWYVASV